MSKQIAYKPMNDEATLHEIQMIIEHHIPRQPYSSNAILRIKDLINKHLEAKE